MQWLAHAAYRVCDRALQQSMELSWHEGFDHRPADSWLPNPRGFLLPVTSVTPTNTEVTYPSDEMDLEDMPF